MINSEKQKSTRDMKERERKRYNELKKQIRTLENNNYELHINLLKVKEEMKLLRVENLIAKNEIAKMEDQVTFDILKTANVIYVIVETLLWSIISHNTTSETFEVHITH